MNADPGSEAEPDSEHNSEHNSELSDMVSAIAVSADRGAALKGAKNGTRQRPRLSDRKLSLQEREAYQGSARLARRPTVESKHVSVSDSPVTATPN